MTSRDVSRRRLQDQLDLKIRWVLRAGVADVRPPSRVWQRIVDCLDQHAAVKQVVRSGGCRCTYRNPPYIGLRRKFRLACQGLALWLFDSAVELPAEFAYCYRPRLSDVRDRDYLRLLMYQCDLPMRLGHAM